MLPIRSHTVACPDIGASPGTNPLGGGNPGEESKRGVQRQSEDDDEKCRPDHLIKTAERDALDNVEPETTKADIGDECDSGNYLQGRAA